MPSIVKATPRMAAGSMQLVSYNFETQPDNTLAVSAQFICLPAFADANISLLRTGAPAPAVLMASGEIVRLLQSVKATDVPTVRSASAQTNYGLTTINVTLGVQIPPAFIGRTLDAESESQLIAGSGSLVPSAGSGSSGSSVGGVGVSGTIDGGSLGGGSGATDGTASQAQEAAKSNYEITTSVDLKSLSGSVLLRDSGSSVSFSFSYYAETITTEGNASPNTPFVDRPFAVRSGSSQFLAWIERFTIKTRRTYRNALGVQKLQQTSSGVYIQNIFEI